MMQVYISEVNERIDKLLQYVDARFEAMNTTDDITHQASHRYADRLKQEIKDLTR